MGLFTWWRNRRAVKTLLADPLLAIDLADADEACQADLAELELAGAGPDFGDLLAAKPNPGTDRRDH